MNKIRIALSINCLLLILVWHSTVYGAGDGADSVFCAWAQQVVAGTELQANVVTHTDHEQFVLSKAATSPLTVQQYWSNPLPGDEGMARVVSCKMKTAERINAAYLAETGENVEVARGDGSCDKVGREMLAALLNRIPRSELKLHADRLQVDPETTTFIGPLWLNPWPFQPLETDRAGRIHLKSRALYVPFAWWIPMPDRFQGTYYCHLVAPDYLEAVLRGEVIPDS